MAKFYASRFRVSDSLGILKVFPDGDIQSVDFNISNAVFKVQGQSFNSRETTGYGLGNLDLSFTINVLNRANKSFQDLAALWDYSDGNSVRVSFDSEFVQSFQTLGSIKFIAFDDVLPEDSSLSSPAESTVSTVQYRFFARNYDTS